jgi:hypothetical protein
MDGMTQLQAVADEKGNLTAVVGYRAGGIWYGQVQGTEAGELKILWHLMPGEMKK